MAPSSSPSRPPPPKQEASATKRLFELLQEKQEPFVLEVYLLEKRPHRPPQNYSVVSQGSNYGCLSCEKSSACPRSSTTESSSKLEKGRARSKVPANSFKCSRIAKALLSKVVSVNEIVEVKSATAMEIDDGKEIQTRFDKEPKGDQEIIEDLEGSPPSTDNSCSGEIQTPPGSDEIDEVEVTSTSKGHLNHFQPANKHVFQWKTVEENKACSPVSVLDPVKPVPVNHDSGRKSSKQRVQAMKTSKTSAAPTSNLTHRKKVVTEECLLSASLWELLDRSQMENNSSSCTLCPSNPVYSKHVRNSKRAMHQSRQLIFDCVREAVQTTRAKKKQRKDKDEKEEKGGLIMRPEEIGKYTCDNMLIKSSTWRKQMGEKKLMIGSELVGSTEEWPWVYEYNAGMEKEIGKEVGDSILEEIKDELFEDMLDFLFYCKDVD